MKKVLVFVHLSIVLFYSILFYYSYRYYNDVELVEISVGEEYKLDRIRGTALSNLNYIIYYQGKVYDREYKALGLSNLLWSDDDFYDNKRHPKDPIYFYRLKSEKDLQKTSRYFLPSAKKPITNKIILALDIWGYFMANWFWGILFFCVIIFYVFEKFVSVRDEKESHRYVFVFGFLLISNMFIKDELQDYIEAMQNEEAQARAAINVITENY